MCEHDVPFIGSTHILVPAMHYRRTLGTSAKVSPYPNPPLPVSLWYDRTLDCQDQEVRNERASIPWSETLSQEFPVRWISSHSIIGCEGTYIIRSRWSRDTTSSLRREIKYRNEKRRQKTSPLKLTFHQFCLSYIYATHSKHYTSDNTTLCFTSFWG